MATVGIRELKAHTSEILRRVGEDGETIEITRRGQTIARIVPVEPRSSQTAIDRFWEQHDELVQVIAAELGDTPIDVVELLNEQRRNLTPDEWVDTGPRGEG